MGEEKLRLAPTPHHTIDMMDEFVDDLISIWLEKNLPLRSMEKYQQVQMASWKTNQLEKLLEKS